VADWIWGFLTRGALQSILAFYRGCNRSIVELTSRQQKPGRSSSRRILTLEWKLHQGKMENNPVVQVFLENQRRRINVTPDDALA